MIYKISIGFKNIFYWIIFILFSIVIGMIIACFSEQALMLFVKIENFLEQFNSFSVLLVAVLGWLFTVWLQNKNIKDNLKVQIKYNIYKQLVVVNKNIQVSMDKIATQVRFATINNFDFSLEKWNLFVSNLKNTYFEFFDQYYSLLCVFDDWMVALASLQLSKKTMYEILNKEQENIFQQYILLETYASNKGINLVEWDKKDINNILGKIDGSIDKIQNSINPFMSECQKELIGESFDYEKTYLEKK